MSPSVWTGVQNPAHGPKQVSDLERLAHKGSRPATNDFPFRSFSRVPTGDYHSSLRIDRQNLLQTTTAAHAGHDEIHNDQIDPVLFAAVEFQGTFPIGGGEDLVAVH